MSTPPPGDDDRDFPSLVRQYVREELQDVHTAALAIVEDVDRTRMRAELVLKHDPGIYIDNVPIASPYAADGVGDLPPIREGDEGVAIFVDLPLDGGGRGDGSGGALVRRGTTETTRHREHRVDDAIFLPALVWYDRDEVPAHDEGRAERTVTHPDGSALRMHGARTELSHGPSDASDAHQTGRMRVHLTDSPYHDADRDGMADAVTVGARGGTADVSPHARDELQVWPRQGELAGVLSHPSGTGVAITEQGVSIAASPHGDAGSGADGERRRELVLGQPTDPERIHVRQHRHEIEAPHPVTDENVTVSGNGSATVTIPHSLGERPGHVNVEARNAAARGVFNVDEKTASGVTIAYETAPPVGTDNLAYDVLVVPPRDADAPVTVTSAPLTRREETARFTTPAALEAVHNAAQGDVQTAKTRAENHRAFHEFYAPQTATDPSDPDAWPDCEHVPETSEWLAWDDPAYDPITFTPGDDATTGLDIDEPLDP